MCIRHETPLTHITYMLRQRTSIVYIYRPINRSFSIIFLHFFLQTMNSLKKKIVKCVMEVFEIKKELEYQNSFRGEDFF